MSSITTQELEQMTISVAARLCLFICIQNMWDKYLGQILLHTEP